jgi:hypothetical protein
MKSIAHLYPPWSMIEEWLGSSRVCRCEPPTWGIFAYFHLF